MILRGITLPLGSLRSPVSMGCCTKVLIWMTSPFLACLGSLRRGLSAMRFTRLLLSAAAADRNLDLLAIGIEPAVVGLCDDDHVLSPRQPDTRSSNRAPRQ